MCSCTFWLVWLHSDSSPVAGEEAGWCWRHAQTLGGRRVTEEGGREGGKEREGKKSALTCDFPHGLMVIESKMGQWI